MNKIKKISFVSLFVFLFIFSGICCVSADEGGYTIDQCILVDNESVSFIIKGVEIDETWGTAFKVFLENKTSKNLMFTIDSSSVNGYNCDPFWASEVAAGKKENTDITFYDLEESNISAIDKWTFVLDIFDLDDWLADSLIKESFTIYPTGLDEASVVVPERRKTDTEKIIYSDDRFDFIILDTSVDEIWGYNINCYLDNKTDNNIMFSWENVSVNGFMCDPFWATEIPAHTKAYNSVSFYDSQLNENNLTYDEISDIEFTLCMNNSDDWDTGAVVENNLTYTVG
ncbi:MAG: hypothetical protein Q4F31_10440 [Eubacteriales bacterium]|nr:hypothetical protein [Eubacteriales bacterium]